MDFIPLLAFVIPPNWLDTTWISGLIGIIASVGGAIAMWWKNREEIAQLKNKTKVDAFDSIIKANEEFRQSVISENDKYKQDIKNANEKIMDLEKKLIELDKENSKLQLQIEQYKVLVESLKQQVTACVNQLSNNSRT
jgi:predicted RNase H-like nuclease (RuvC/YqgF family)